VRILITDDSKAVHAFIRSLLEGTPYHPTHAYNGSEALDVLEKNHEAFDLMLLDWEMPVLDGPSTLAELRARGLKIPVVMITTKNDLESIAHALSLGATDYVMKPFTKDIMLEKLAQYLGKGAA
jgi:two-component system chemotaxis response regulator CheY